MWPKGQTPSFGYMEPKLKVARDFPNVKFESITGCKAAPNVAVANARYMKAVTCRVTLPP